MSAKMTEAGQRLLAAAREALSIAQGKSHPARIWAGKLVKDFCEKNPDIPRAKVEAGLSECLNTGAFRLGYDMNLEVDE